MNAPFTAVHFSTYEAAKRGLMEVASEETVGCGQDPVAVPGYVLYDADFLCYFVIEIGCHIREISRISVSKSSVAGNEPDKEIVHVIEDILKLKLSVMTITTLEILMLGEFHMADMSFDLGFLNAQGVCGCARFSSSSMKEVIQSIIRRDGYVGLMRGWGPRMLFHAPAAAICWSTYEAAKSFFQEINNKKIPS
ncbi:uncharacterized protein A4U43_C08F33940 [Asparagus officinalis]|nr:uncharacterized protein A4U43_C08F33940 [Asparagus officinalis]